MKNDNRGVTLVELMVSIIIFGIIVSAVFGFMLAGSRSYNTATDRLNTDVKAQLTLNQLESYIIDCNSSLYFNSGKLYVLNLNTDGSYTVNLFEFKADNCIYFGSAAKPAGTFSSPAKASEILASGVTANDLLSDDVSSFSVTPISADGTRVNSAIVNVSFSGRSSSYSGKRIVALRNKPLLVPIIG